jgi:hypothetical protein
LAMTLVIHIELKPCGVKAIYLLKMPGSKLCLGI